MLNGRGRFFYNKKRKVTITMAKKQRRTLEEQIELALKELKQKESRLRDLRARQRTQDDKARTHRLCRRGGYLESKLPELITITDEQFYTFVEKALLSGFAQKLLKSFIGEGNAKHSNGVNTTVAEPVQDSRNHDSNRNHTANNTHSGENPNNRTD